VRLGEVLVLRGAVSVTDLAAALEKQRITGGKLGENLLALEKITPKALTDALEQTPAMPRSVRDTGIARGSLLNLLLKFMRLESCELIPDLIKRMRLQYSVIQELIDGAVAQKLVYVMGTISSGSIQYSRYGLTEQGKTDASSALEQSQYTGPAPVSLAAYKTQILKQAIALEQLDYASVQKSFPGLVVNDLYMQQLLPAANAGQTVLLYGPPGNGKTSIGRLIASFFRNPIHIPYAVEVDGQIIKLYDESLHHPFISNASAVMESVGALSAVGGLQTESFDSRWAICKRPVAVAGGELSLDMLELQYDSEAKTYDAPLHMKAINGVFLIDDFGRQKVSPTDLLNRWIVPMENRVDYLKLKTGKSITLPFDELLIFSTNLSPADLMDPAFLRRIPYKILMAGPDAAAYRIVFDQVAGARGLSFSDEVFNLIVERLTSESGHELAFFQPKFICDQVQQVCHCFGLPPVITKELAERAIANLYVKA
jgi:hypothetical protein